VLRLILGSILDEAYEVPSERGQDKVCVVVKGPPREGAMIVLFSEVAREALQAEVSERYAQLPPGSVVLFREGDVWPGAEHVETAAAMRWVKL